MLSKFTTRTRCPCRNLREHRGFKNNRSKFLLEKWVSSGRRFLMLLRSSLIDIDALLSANKTLVGVFSPVMKSIVNGSFFWRVDLASVPNVTVSFCTVVSKREYNEHEVLHGKASTRTSNRSQAVMLRTSPTSHHLGIKVSKHILILFLHIHYKALPVSLLCG